MMWYPQALPFSVSFQSSLSGIVSLAYFITSPCTHSPHILLISQSIWVLICRAAWTATGSHGGPAGFSKAGGSHSRWCQELRAAGHLWDAKTGRSAARASWAGHAASIPWRSCSRSVTSPSSSFVTEDAATLAVVPLTVVDLIGCNNLLGPTYCLPQKHDK